MSILDRLKTATAQLEADYAKAAGGNKSARVRARHTLMEIKRIAADGRVELSPKKGEEEAA